MNHPFLANLLRRNESSTGFRLAPLRFSFASCSIPSKCMNNLREKVLGTHVKRDTPKAPRFAGFVLWVPCLLKKVSQTNHPPWPDSFILRFHDLAFLHFRRFGQVGYLVTVQTWQRTKSWRASCHFAIFPSLVNFDFHFILSLAGALCAAL